MWRTSADLRRRTFGLDVTSGKESSVRTIWKAALYVESMNEDDDDGFRKCNCRRGRGWRDRDETRGRRKERKEAVAGGERLATVIAVIFLALLKTTAGSSTVRMVTRPQMFEIDRGSVARLVCEFFDERFNLFDNPIVWRKHQRVRHRPLAAVTGPSGRVPLVDVEVEDDYDEDDELTLERPIDTIETSQINMMGNVIEPFASTGRFKPTWQPSPPHFLFSLTITNVSIVDIGNYSCEIGGPQNTIVALVTHQLTVRANVDNLLITDEDGDVPVAIAASNYSYPPPGGLSPFIHRPLLVLTEGRQSSLRCIAVGGHPTPYLRIHITGGRSGRDGGWEPTASVASPGGVGDADGQSSSSSMSSSQPSSSPLLLSAGRRRWYSTYAATSLDDRDDKTQIDGADPRYPYSSPASPLTVVSTWSDQGRRGLRSFSRVTELGSRLSDVYGRDDTIAAVAASSSVVGGGGRTVRRRGGDEFGGSIGGDGALRRRTWFTVGLADDGAEVRCTATVGGLPDKVVSSRIVVQHLSVVECFNGTANLGERIVHVRCELRARPDVTSLRWIVDDNLTSVGENEVVNEFWTIRMDRTDGVIEVQLFLRQTRPSSFRSYKLVANNGVASTEATVWLLHKQPVPRPTRLEASSGRGRRPESTSSFDKYIFPFVPSRTCRRCHVTQWLCFVPLAAAVHLVSAILNRQSSATRCRGILSSLSSFLPATCVSTANG